MEIFYVIKILFLTIAAFIFTVAWTPLLLTKQELRPWEAS